MLTNLHTENGPDNGEGYRLGLFERWIQRFLPTITNTADRRMITMFANWHEHRRIIRSIENGSIKTWSIRCARQRITHGAVFLNWLHEDQHTVLADCTQTNIDSWFTTGNHGRQSAVGFIVWAKDRQLCDRRLQITPIKPATPPGMPHQARVELIRRLLTDTSLRLDDRVAGLLVALYAQPTSRICRLQRHDITITETGIQLKIGGQPIAPIEPFATLLKQLAETANHQWLFPGDIPGEPIGPNMISQRLRRIGLNRNTRIGALHDLIQQIPGPVLAELIGYNPNFVAERALTLAAPWTNYPNVRQRT